MRAGVLSYSIARLATALVLGVSFLGCSGDDGDTDDTQVTMAGCESCHGSEEMLVATVEPDTGEPPESTGEG